MAILNMSNEELAIKIYNIISNADLFDINLEDIPKRMDDKNFRKEILNILFKNYVVLQYPTILEMGADGELEKNEYGIENNGICDEKLRINTIVVDSISAIKIKKDVEQLKEQYKTHALIQRDGTRIPLINRLVVTDNTLKYKKILSDDHSFWRFSVGSKVFQAINDVQEKKDAEARQAFRRNRYPNKKKFADAIVIYAEIFRDIYDVHKIIDRFLSINKWINGEETKSKITCLFNTDTKHGQNGKSQRMRFEKKYMTKNGFRTAEKRLCFDHCKDENEFTEHLFYKDEFDFVNSNPDDMKTIHNNPSPTITKRVMYKGDIETTNEAFFYLCAHNGKTSEVMTNNDRLADWIRISDAKYIDNADKLTAIYEDKPFENDGLFNQICYEDLYDVLFKCAPENYNTSKILKRPAVGISVHAETIEILDSFTTAGLPSITLSKIFSKLSKNRYFPKEKAKQEVRILYEYLMENYPELIENMDKKNWIEKSIKLHQNNCVSTVSIIELANAASTTDIDTNLIDRETLKRYVYSLFDLDVDLPFENPRAYYTLEELQPIYDKWCDTFIPLTRTKIDKSYTDKNGERLDLIYEGVNIARNGVTIGHTSRFSNDNMLITPRFLVEYDAPEGSSGEEIEKAKQDMLKLAEQWPTFRLVDSGNKSIHVLFCFDLQSLPNTEEEYKFAVRYAVKQLNIPEKIGCAELDYKALVDPSRITRRPGELRENGKVQSLIAFSKQRVHIDWRDSYNEQKAIMEKNKKEALKLKILTESMFEEDDCMKSDNVRGFIEAYMLKHGLVWVEGQRHSVAAKLAGACNLAEFTVEESIAAMKEMFDCSDDPSILSNLGKYFDK